MLTTSSTLRYLPPQSCAYQLVRLLEEAPGMDSPVRNLSKLRLDKKQQNYTPDILKAQGSGILMYLLYIAIYSFLSKLRFKNKNIYVQMM